MGLQTGGCAKNTVTFNWFQYPLFFFSCVCSEGWTGQQCSEDINECDSEPCLNGASCYESSPGQFLCVCPPFYIGRTCQYRYNPCDAPYNPCINNSTCLAQVDGKPLCICQKGKFFKVTIKCN